MILILFDFGLVLAIILTKVCHESFCKSATQVCKATSKARHKYCLCFVIYFILLQINIVFTEKSSSSCPLNMYSLEGGSSRASSKSATIEMYVGSNSYNETLSGETLSSLSESEHRQQLEVRRATVFAESDNYRCYWLLNWVI